MVGGLVRGDGGEPSEHGRRLQQNCRAFKEAVTRPGVAGVQNRGSAGHGQKVHHA